MFGDEFLSLIDFEPSIALSFDVFMLFLGISEMTRSTLTAITLFLTFVLISNWVSRFAGITSSDRPHIEFALMFLISLFFFSTVIGKNCTSKVTVRIVLHYIASCTFSLWSGCCASFQINAGNNCDWCWANDSPVLLQKRACEEPEHGHTSVFFCNTQSTESRTMVERASVSLPLACPLTFMTPAWFHLREGSCGCVQNVILVYSNCTVHHMYCMPCVFKGIIHLNIMKK